MYEVNDTVVLITGAAKGIGAAFVKVLVEQGAKKEPYHSTTGVRVLTICYGPTTTGIIEQMASFDEDIQMHEVAASDLMQSAEVAAQRTLEAYRRGESGSTWLINKGKPAKDITSTINKAYAEFAHPIELTLRDD